MNIVFYNISFVEGIVRDSLGDVGVDMKILFVYYESLLDLFFIQYLKVLGIDFFVNCQLINFIRIYVSKVLLFLYCFNFIIFKILGIIYILLFINRFFYMNNLYVR